MLILYNLPQNLVKSNFGKNLLQMVRKNRAVYFEGIPSDDEQETTKENGTKYNTGRKRKGEDLSSKAFLIFMNSMS